MCDYNSLEYLHVVIIGIGSSAVQGTWDGVEFPHATAGFSAPHVLAALVHLSNSEERWTQPVDFIGHDR